MNQDRKIRLLWLGTLFTTLDAWIAVVAMWLLIYVLEPDQVDGVARSLSWLVVLGVCLALVCGLILMHLLPRLPAQASRHGAIITVRHCFLLMLSALGAIFLCMLYITVNG